MASKQPIISARNVTIVYAKIHLNKKNKCIKKCLLNLSYSDNRPITVTVLESVAVILSTFAKKNSVCLYKYFGQFSVLHMTQFYITIPESGMVWIEYIWHDQGIKC